MTASQVTQQSVCVMTEKTEQVGNSLVDAVCGTNEVMPRAKKPTSSVVKNASNTSEMNASPYYPAIIKATKSFYAKNGHIQILL